MHPSLLPKYRGAAPIHHAILNVFLFRLCKKQGDKETGVSIITLSDKKIDAGKCLYQKTLEIDPLMHYPQLAAYLALEGGMAVMDTLYNIDTITPMDQV